MLTVGGCGYDYTLTPWSRTLLEKLIVTQSRNISLPCSQFSIVTIRVSFCMDFQWKYS